MKVVFWALSTIHCLRYFLDRRIPRELELEQKGFGS